MDLPRWADGLHFVLHKEYQHNLKSSRGVSSARVSYSREIRAVVSRVDWVYSTNVTGSNLANTYLSVAGLALPIIIPVPFLIDIVGLRWSWSDSAMDLPKEASQEGST